MTAHELTVEAGSRWDAMELLRRLQALRTTRTYMIQNAPDRWTVCVRPNDGHAPPAADLLRHVESWLAERRLGAARVQLDGRDMTLTA